MTTRRALLTGLAVLPTLTALPAFARTAETPDAALDSAFAAAGPPALAGAVIGRAGIEWSGVRGVRREGSTEAATIDDKWHLGSNTKAMTAAVYGRLVDKGLTRWERPVADIFPEIAADAAWAGVPVEALMRHRAGLSDAALLPREIRVAARDDVRPLVEQRLERVRAALTAAPTGTPGVFVYGNINFVLVGAVIERLTGLAWEDAIQAELWGPLGITTGGFGAPEGDQPWGHQAEGGVITPLDPALKPDNPPLLGPAGTAHMKAADYARFIGLFLNEGGGVLTPETTRTLITPPTDEARSYALGWMVQRAPWAAGPTIGHEGSNTLWHAIVVADPTGGRAFVAFSNDETRGGPACQGLVRRLIQLSTVA